MKCEDVHEDIEAYALGALDQTQRQRVESHLRHCSDCYQSYRSARVTVDHLALAVPLYRASPRLKERIMGGIGSFHGTRIGPAFLRTKWAASAAALVLMAFAIGGLTWAVMLSSEVRQLQHDNSQLIELTQLDAEQRTALLRLQSDLSAARIEQREMVITIEEQASLLVIAFDPELIPTDLQGTSLAPQSQCSYVWSSKQSVGALTCKGLPTTSFNVNYELWATKGDKTVPVGSFLPRADGSAQLLVRFPADAPGPISDLFVTLEQQNASRSQPTGQVVLEPSPVQQAAR
ncbi:MAG: hypothetical protein GEU75_13680 [Dehalococcoidia bacterium]|nr:hypothetical protein [Dehalococcoidia bacterium]